MNRGARLSLLTAILLGAVPASAYHTFDEPLIDDSAYTLRQAEFRAGFLSLEGGVTDFLTVSTMPVGWLFKVPNLRAKLGLYDDGRVALGVDAGFATITIEKSNSGAEATLLILPLKGAVSWRVHDALTVSSEVVYNKRGCPRGRAAGRLPVCGARWRSPI